MKAELKCTTKGFPFGEVVESGKDIDSKTLKSLVAEGLAVEVSPKVVASDKELKARITELETENAMLKERIAELETENAPAQGPLPEGDDGRPVEDYEWGELKSLASKVYGADIKGMKKDDVVIVIENGRKAVLGVEQ